MFRVGEMSACLKVVASLVVVAWLAGLVCRVGVWSARLVIVMWPRSASLVVVTRSAGLVCRVGVRSARLVVVVWPIGLVWIVECWFQVTLMTVVGPMW